jgi:hypothetical protein
VIKDGDFTSVDTVSLTSRSSPASNIRGVENRAIASGTYDISFQQAPWPNATIFVSDVRYVCVSGTQIVEVTGYATMDSTSTPGTIVFTTPFPTGAQIKGGTSSCYSSPTVSIPSVCTCVNSGVSLYVALSSPVTRVDYTVHLIAPISGV